MSDLPDPTQIARPAGWRVPPEAEAADPSAPAPFSVMAGETRRAADETDEDRAHRKLVGTINRLMTNLPREEAAEAIAKLITPGGVPGAEEGPADERGARPPTPCDICGALTLDDEFHRDWHYAQAWGEDPV